MPPLAGGQCRLGRIPDLTAPTPFPEQVARAPGQGVADQPAAEGDAGQAARARPRPQLLVPVAKTPPTTPRPQQQGAPPPPSAEDQGFPVDGLPQGEDADGPGEDLQSTAPSGTRSASDDPGQDVLGALIGDILLAEAPPTILAAPAADLPAAGPPLPCGQPEEPPFSPLADFGDEEEAAQVPALEAAQVAEELEEAARVLVPEGEVDDAAAGGRSAEAQPGGAAWLGGSDTDARFPVRPGAYQGPATPPEALREVKQEQEERE